MSTQAYRQAQRITESPRQAEYRLLAQVTGALIDAKDRKGSPAQLAEVLDWNRQIWDVLGAQCLDDRNQLPPQTRAHIIDLSRWVAVYSRGVLRKGASMDPLIEVNRTIMQGLQGQP